MSSSSKGIRQEEGPVFRHFEADGDGGWGIEKDGNFIQLCWKKIKDTFFSLNYEEEFFQSGAGAGVGSRAGGLNLEGLEPEPFRSR